MAHKNNIKNIAPLMTNKIGKERMVIKNAAYFKYFFKVSPSNSNKFCKAKDATKINGTTNAVRKVPFMWWMEFKKGIFKISDAGIMPKANEIHRNEYRIKTKWELVNFKSFLIANIK